MFEDYTFENILNRMLAGVPTDVDKREGSVIYDALAPMAVEFSLMYLELENMLKQCFAATADRSYLMLRAKERGLEPYSATAPVLRGIFDPEDAPVEGKRFNLDSLNYVAGERLADGGRAMYCETRGTEGNFTFGTLTPLEYIEGLKSAAITQLITQGCDPEDTEAFRQRYFNSLSTQAFGGNVADYKQKLKGLNSLEEITALGGIGQVRVYCADEWNGGGTVKAVITTASNQQAGAELLQAVQQLIDPVAGKGVGIAPVGHIVTLATVDYTPVDISLSLKVKEGYSKELLTPLISERLQQALEEYNKSWEALYNGEEQGITIAVSYITSLVQAIEGVVAIEAVSLNGLGFGRTLQLPKDSLATLGKVNGEVSL